MKPDSAQRRGRGQEIKLEEDNQLKTASTV